MRIETVVEYNQRKQNSFNEALKLWQHDKYPCYPCRGMFLFLTRIGRERKTGYIASNDTKACFGKTKKKAIEALNS